ncbi:DHHC palmitoyltransferase-domain-containing protein [Rhodotorula diobovata]|uniref:Palmitoyltransferase n=1 Tax=Rhodotorula diobovata TaxID=5288 RepID=A0A5C5G0G1_9BASI|nr:DHHC palmitoyltransferase-domain-containing protein [Rhodotorula diobovata]
MPPMHTQRRALPARPLLSFPPDPPRPTLPRRDEERPRSALFRLVALLPLVAIFALLAFASYACLWSLCITYLVGVRGHTAKGITYALIHSWLVYGCGGSFWMAYWRGGGIVPGAGDYKRSDEEARVADEGLKADVETFVLGRRSGEEEVAPPVQGAETERLLEGDEDAAHAHSHRGQSRRFLQVKSDGTARFCRKCNIHKPDRAHHCSSCRRCVLKMDHHCPWLGGGCVGWANYKFFLLALLYTGLLGAFLAVVLFRELVNFVNDTENGFEMAPISWALAALLGAIFGFAVGAFGLYHLYLVSKNRTTIEAMEQPTSLALLNPPPSSRLQPHDLTSKQRRSLAAAARRYSIYDLGAKENFKQVFGDKWWLWGVPVGWPSGDGQSFPINTAHLSALKRATAAVYAEAAASRYEAREGSFDLETATASGSEDGASDEGGPLRRA